MHAPGEADLNLYAYVSGQVLKNVDPLGLQDVPAAPGRPSSRCGCGTLVRPGQVLPTDDGSVHVHGKMRISEKGFVQKYAGTLGTVGTVVLAAVIMRRAPPGASTARVSSWASRAGSSVSRLTQRLGDAWTRANQNWAWNDITRNRIAPDRVPYEPLHHAVVPQGGRGALTLRGSFRSSGAASSRILQRIVLGTSCVRRRLRGSWVRTECENGTRLCTEGMRPTCCQMGR